MTLAALHFLTELHSLCGGRSCSEERWELLEAEAAGAVELALSSTNKGKKMSERSEHRIIIVFSLNTKMNSVEQHCFFFSFHCILLTKYLPACLTLIHCLISLKVWKESGERAVVE